MVASDPATPHRCCIHTAWKTKMLNLKMDPTVDGSEIRRSPVDMVNPPIIYDGFHTC